MLQYERQLVQYYAQQNQQRRAPENNRELVPWIIPSMLGKPQGPRCAHNKDKPRESQICQRQSRPRRMQEQWISLLKIRQRIDQQHYGNSQSPENVYSGQPPPLF